MVPKSAAMDDCLEAVHWAGDAVEYLDQRRLPHEQLVRRARTVDEIEKIMAEGRAQQHSQ
jgi:methylthioribose-1-phosphate isomerase